MVFSHLDMAGTPHTCGNGISEYAPKRCCNYQCRSLFAPLNASAVDIARDQSHRKRRGHRRPADRGVGRREQLLPVVDDVMTRYPPRRVLAYDNATVVAEYKRERHRRGSAGDDRRYVRGGYHRGK